MEWIANLIFEFNDDQILFGMFQRFKKATPYGGTRKLRLTLPPMRCVVPKKDTFYATSGTPLVVMHFIVHGNWFSTPFKVRVSVFGQSNWNWRVCAEKDECARDENFYLDPVDSSIAFSAFADLKCDSLIVWYENSSSAKPINKLVDNFS